MCAPKTHIIIFAFILHQPVSSTVSHSRYSCFCPVSKYMNIRSVWNVCHLFIYITCYAHSQHCIENIPFLALINNFIIKYSSRRIFMFFPFILFHSQFFLLSFRYYLLQRFCHLSDTLMEILHLCCDL